MMFYRGFNGEARATRRHRFQQEAIYLAAINQIHQHFAVITTAGDDADKPRRRRTQMHRQFFHIGTDHRSVDDSDANLVLANGYVRLRYRVRVDNVVQAAC